MKISVKKKKKCGALYTVTRYLNGVNNVVDCAAETY